MRMQDFLKGVTQKVEIWQKEKKKGVAHAFTKPPPPPTHLLLATSRSTPCMYVCKMRYNITSQVTGQNPPGHVPPGYLPPGHVPPGSCIMC